jgi:serine/threonine-protein phosphatase 5
MNKYPGRIFALKGNHEDYTENGTPKFFPCTLKEEVEQKKGNWISYYKNNLKPLLDKLYLSVIIQDLILFVHGGISSQIKSLKDLQHPTIRIEQDVLWSDPFNGYGEKANRRGAGVEFGLDISKKVCDRLNLKFIIRSHQPRKANKGPLLEHKGRVLTISSTSIYGGKPFILKLPTSMLRESSINFERSVYYL